MNQLTRAHLPDNTGITREPLRSRNSRSIENVSFKIISSVLVKNTTSPVINSRIIGVSLVRYRGAGATVRTPQVWQEMVFRSCIGTRILITTVATLSLM